MPMKTGEHDRLTVVAPLLACAEEPARGECSPAAPKQRWAGQSSREDQWWISTDRICF